MPADKDHGANSPCAPSRKNSKPIMEKRRRARINASLTELKALLLDVMKKEQGTRHNKMEKADILEMTVRHLRNVQRHQLACAAAVEPTVVSRYQLGFAECATEVTRYLGTVDGVDGGLRSRVVQHLSHAVRDIAASAPAQSDITSSITQPVTTSLPQMPRIQSPAISTNLKDTNNNMAAVTHNALPVMTQPCLQANIDSQVQAGSSQQQVLQGIQLIPSRLPSGEVAFIIPSNMIANASLTGGNGLNMAPPTCSLPSNVLPTTSLPGYVIPLYTGPTVITQSQVVPDVRRNQASPCVSPTYNHTLDILQPCEAQAPNLPTPNSKTHSDNVHLPSTSSPPIDLQPINLSSSSHASLSSAENIMMSCNISQNCPSVTSQSSSMVISQTSSTVTSNRPPMMMSQSPPMATPLTSQTSTMWNSQMSESPCSVVSQLPVHVQPTNSTIIGVTNTGQLVKEAENVFKIQHEDIIPPVIEVRPLVREIGAPQKVVPEQEQVWRPW